MLISSGASVIGVASDVGGSIRSPATFCGIFGHKPTKRLVSVEGHKPNCIHVDKWTSIFNIGPMARYACDLSLLLNILSEDVPKDKIKLNEVNVKDIKIYYMENDAGNIFTSRIDPEITQGMKRVLEYFKTHHDVNPENVISTILNWPFYDFRNFR